MPAHRPIGVLMAWGCVRRFTRFRNDVEAYWNKASSRRPLNEWQRLRERVCSSYADFEWRVVRLGKESVVPDPTAAPGQPRHVSVLAAILSEFTATSRGEEQR